VSNVFSTVVLIGDTRCITDHTCKTVPNETGQRTILLNSDLCFIGNRLIL